MSFRAVFAGPSLSPSAPVPKNLVRLLPPARYGDVFRAVCNGASAIGIVDGVFETEQAVWHREILWALSRRIPVYGAASMGALRALETESFGMLGIGTIFQWYQTGRIEDDEEVAVLHSPVELGYRPMTEASVNVRASLDRAIEEGICSDEEASLALAAAKSVYYKERSRDVLLSKLSRDYPLSKLADWLHSNWVDQKSADAHELLELFTTSANLECNAPNTFTFHETVHWHRFKESEGSLLKPQ